MGVKVFDEVDNDQNHSGLFPCVLVFTEREVCEEFL